MSKNKAEIPEGIPVQQLKDQLLIVLAKRLGGEIEVPVSELDDTGGDMLEFQVINNPAKSPQPFFQIRVSKKQ